MTQKVQPVFHDYQIEVEDDEAESLRRMGLLREPLIPKATVANPAVATPKEK